MAANVEHLELLADTSIVATGNALANLITGNAGNNTLSGGTGDGTLIAGFGADVLSGGTGKDAFRFLSLGEGGDTIKDFALGDRIEVRGSVFGSLGIGALDTSLFEIVVSEAATKAETRFFYDTVLDKLYLDSAGKDGAAAVPLASFSTTTTVPTANDIRIA